MLPFAQARVVELGFCDDVSDSAGAAVTDADLVILCVPVGVMADVAAEIAADLPADAVISDVGSSKDSVQTALAAALPGARIIPAHPVAGTENSGPDAGFSTLFHDRSEVIKYSAGGFRDFTRIAASDPTMWRDVFLSNKEAVLEMLQRFSEDLTALQRAIRWDKGDELFDLFTKTRAIRRRIIEEGQDDAAPDFGRTHD